MRKNTWSLQASDTSPTAVHGIKAGRALSTENIRDHLCEDCEALNLNIDKFIIDHRRATDDNTAHAWPDFPKDTRTFIQIDGNKHCPLCRLLALSMGTPPENASSEYPSERNRATCKLYWTVDGRERIDGQQHGHVQIVKRTRRLVIGWSNKESSEVAYLVLVAPEGRLECGVQGDKLETDLNRTDITDNDEWQRPMMFFGRFLSSVDHSSLDCQDVAETVQRQAR